MIDNEIRIHASVGACVVERFAPAAAIIDAEAFEHASALRLLRDQFSHREPMKSLKHIIHLAEAGADMTQALSNGECGSPSAYLWMQAGQRWVHSPRLKKNSQPLAAPSDRVLRCPTGALACAWQPGPSQ